jgi:hypothetical protein
VVTREVRGERWRPAKAPAGRWVYLLPTYTHFQDDHTPHVWHRLNEGHRNVALQTILDSPGSFQFASNESYWGFMRASNPARNLQAQSS